MQFSLIVCVAIFACANARVYLTPEYELQYPDNYEFSEHDRHARSVADIHYEGEYEKGKLFGTLGSTDAGLFGRFGYKQEMFNDNRGRAEAQAFGARQISPYGDSSSFGGRMDWADKNAKAAVEVSKQIGGGTSVTATGSGVWHVDKNTEVSAGGMVSKQLGPGKADYGVQAQYQHDF